MAEPVLRAESLDVRAGTATDLASVSFSVEPVGLTALIGPDAWDKDTLVAVLQGRRRPARGTLRLAGRPITGMTPDARVRQGLAWTTRPLLRFATTTLIDALALAIHALRTPSPLDFWRLRPSRPSTYAALALLDRVGLADCADAAPDSLNEARRARLDIARALAARPRLLIADRITEDVSPSASRELASLLHSLAQAGPAVLWIEDDAMLALETADQVVVLVDGRALVPSAAGREASEQALDAAFLGRSR